MFSAAKSRKATTGGYSVGKSLRFRSSASAYLNRTPSVAGNQTKFTISLWFKRGALTAYGALFDAYSGAGANYGILQLQNDDTLLWFNQTASVITAKIQTNAVYRDPSAWYHVVAVYDSTQATSSNRLAMYINGVQVTSFSISTYPTLNQTNTINGTVPHDIGRYGGAANYFDGYLAEVNFIDGQALTPSSFGAYDTNGVWQPLKYSGTYGTNGFYLNFGNTTSTTTLGYDTSGNSNNWTTNNISLTAGSTYDSMTDSPTVSSASVANYAVGNPLNPDGTTWSNGNLAFSVPNTTNNSQATFAVSSGKWYWETIFTVAHELGVQQTGLTARRTNAVTYNKDGTKYVNGTNSAYGATYTNGDVIGTALDMTGGTVTFYKNNASQGSISLSGAGITNATMTISAGGGSTQTGTVNFGQQPFTYTPPTGFNALNTYNLPTPTIANGAQYMAATLYTGNGSTLTINNGTNTTIGTTFQPDFAWLKSRSAATSNSLSDVLRGIGANSSYPRLISDSTAAESTNGGITSFASTGLTLNADAAITNTNAATYVAWQWKANGAGVSNTNGSITSTVSANTTAGFSVVLYTGTTANSTVGHGLGVAPSFIMAKDRTTADNWMCWHSTFPGTDFIQLNNTGYQNTLATVWNSTVPTSTVFSLGTNNTVNRSGDLNVAYCFAAVSGYSAMGKYTGNGSTDGVFVYTGFRPRWLLIKRTDGGTNGWILIDSSVNTYNVGTAFLVPSSSAAENTGNTDPDFLSNGFKLRDTSTNWNGNGNTYLYVAFAENPFNSSRAR